MILKINPRDVVSIPTDYNNSKGRTCRYEVIGEHNVEDRHETEAFDRPVQDEPGVDTRAVVQVNRNEDLIVEEFTNINAAAAEFGVPVGYISRVLNGGRPATQGYRWFYADDVSFDWE